MNRGRPFSIGERALKEFKEIQGKRKGDIDRELPRPIKMGRLLDKAITYPEWDNIREKLLKEPRVEDIKFI